MNKIYPVIGRAKAHKKNTQAKCKCGEVGQYKIHIEFSRYRGEDQVVWACEAHKDKADYLVFDI